MQHSSSEQKPASVSMSTSTNTSAKKWQQEPLPQAREVAAGIWKITLPIPFPLRTVNLYILVGNNGWAMLDAGMGMPDARVAFQEGLRRAGVSIDNLRTIVLSHDHPDHIGLSGELQERSGATVYMHPIDASSMDIFWHGVRPEWFVNVSGFFRQHGMPGEQQSWFSQARSDQMKDVLRVPPQEAITLVEDGQTLELVGERYRVIWTPGHSDGHICLFRERDGVFLAADHVLPRITPNVGLYSQYDRSNPLGDYLDSLRKVEHLPASIVLPGHGEPFTDLAGRVNEIIEHHEQRETEILHLLDSRPQHAYQLAEQLFGQRLKSSEARRMAVAETLSHLEYLRFGGQVEQQKMSDGVILYAAV